MQNAECSFGYALRSAARDAAAALWSSLSLTLGFRSRSDAKPKREAGACRPQAQPQREAVAVSLMLGHCTLGRRTLGRKAEARSRSVSAAGPTAARSRSCLLCICIEFTEQQNLRERRKEGLPEVGRYRGASG